MTSKISFFLLSSLLNRFTASFSMLSGDAWLGKGARQMRSIPFYQTSASSAAASTMSQRQTAVETPTITAATITFVRHGCSYMNEYLGGADGGKSFGSPGFTDVFDAKRRPQRAAKYRDTALSSRGVEQARALNLRVAKEESARTIKRMEANNKNKHNSALAEDMYGFSWNECTLILTSPLTRALQTFDIGLKSHVLQTSDSSNTLIKSKKSNGEGDNQNKAPLVVALPEAAERLYLISDLGQRVDVLRKQFSFVNFEYCQQREQEHLKQQKEFERQQLSTATEQPTQKQTWWSSPSSVLNLFSNKSSSAPDGKPRFEQQDTGWWWYPGDFSNYVEWRPTGQFQRYACAGEPEAAFDQRMSQLYRILERYIQEASAEQIAKDVDTSDPVQQQPQHIVVVCHHGVIRWMLDQDFHNCQYRTVLWKDLQPKRLLPSASREHEQKAVQAISSLRNTSSS